MKKIIFLGLSALLLISCSKSVEKPVKAVATAPMKVVGAAMVAPPLIGLYAYGCLDATIPRVSFEKDRITDVTVNEHVTKKKYSHTVVCEAYHDGTCGGTGGEWKWREKMPVSPQYGKAADGRDIKISFGGCGGYPNITFINEQGDVDSDAHKYCEKLDVNPLSVMKEPGSMCYSGPDKTELLMKFTYKRKRLKNESH
ncbi:MAG: hypothetical protein VX730_01135 [Pseudomonadota bacterium]|nr:hypothetical protein [Pseudomonadota bacterium]